MGTAMDYRQHAIEQRQAADRTQLPLPRQRHLDAAEKWDRLADEVEWFDRGVGEHTPSKQAWFS